MSSPICSRDWRCGASRGPADMGLGKSKRDLDAPRNRMQKFPLKPSPRFAATLQKTQIGMVCHLANELRDEVDRRGGIAKVDHLVGRVRVAARHPDADRRDAAAAD